MRYYTVFLVVLFCLVFSGINDKPKQTAQTEVIEDPITTEITEDVSEEYTQEIWEAYDGDYDVYPIIDQPIKMKASAYCSGTTTANGKDVRVGLIAGKPEWIGMTAIVRTDIDGKPGDLIGIYEVEDTGGPLISKGIRLDIYNPNYDWCMNFGVKDVWVQLVDAEG